MAAHSKKYRIVVISIVFVLLFALNLRSQQDADLYMGRSIQNYLQGDMEKTIENLDALLSIDPEHKRGRELLERASESIFEEARENENYEDAVGYLETALSAYPDSELIDKRLSELRSLMEPEVELPAQTAEPEEAEEKEIDKAVETSARMNEYKRQIEELTRQLASVRQRMEKEAGAKSDLKNEIEEIKEERRDLKEKLSQMDIAPPTRLPVWIALLFVCALFVFFGFMYIAFKKEFLKLTKNMVRERREMDELKSSYRRDTETLASKLEKYGSSYHRAENLEKNWAKLLNIIQKLTEGGSSYKFVLPESPDGRKAVTGVDPKSRARADTVEVIAEIFKDSPRAPEMLKPFLKDEDNRTRANAALAYFPYDPEKSILVLKEMSLSSDKWMRLSSAWALGEIGDPSTAKVLEKLLDDADSEVKNRARLSLEKIMENREEGELEKEGEDKKD
ncbi:MAG: HEAT repeat domain-containing protein [Elusimicrobiota bacterium]